MVAPLAMPADFNSYYAATLPLALPRPPLQGAVECDVCVVGAGYGGLSAALHLAGRGYRVVVLEAARIGNGASGRNGGHIVTGYQPDMPEVEAMVGRDTARRLWELSEEAKRLLRDTVSRHAIDCHLIDGYLFAANKPRHLAALAAHAEALEAVYGYTGLKLVAGAEMRATIDSPAYVGGLIDPGGGHLHPLRYAFGLAGAAERLGATVHEQTPVIELVPGPRPQARTLGGRVTADHLVLCGGAGRTPLLPHLSRRVMPVRTGMIATAPLPPELADSLIPGGQAVCDAKWIVDYYRLSADRRLLFGGGASYWTGRHGGAAGSLRRAMLTVFPQLAEVAVDYHWSGTIGITFNRMPYLGRTGGNVWFLEAFSGQGVTLTGLAGKLLAEAVAGTAERFDLLARLRHLPFPGGRLRAPMLAAAMTWMRLRDLL